METRYQALIAAVKRAINEADPIGLLEGGAPTDEYTPEIATIVPRIVNAQSVDEVTTVLHEEFLRWFGDTAGPRQAHEAFQQGIPKHLHVASRFGDRAG